MPTTPPQIDEFADQNTAGRLLEWIRSLPVPADFEPDEDRAMLQEYWVLHGNGGAWRKLVWAKKDGVYHITLLGTMGVNRTLVKQLHHLIVAGVPRHKLEAAGVLQDLSWRLDSRYPGALALSEEEKAALLAHPEARTTLHHYREARRQADTALENWRERKSNDEGMWLGGAMLLGIPGFFLFMWLLFLLNLDLAWGILGGVLWIVGLATIASSGGDLFGLAARIQQHPRRFLGHQDREIVQMARYWLWKQGEAVPEAAGADPDTYVRHSLTEYSETLRQDAERAEGAQREYIEAVLQEVEAEKVARSSVPSDTDPTRNAREAEAYLKQLRR